MIGLCFISYRWNLSHVRATTSTAAKVENKNKKSLQKQIQVVQIQCTNKFDHKSINNDIDFLFSVQLGLHFFSWSENWKSRIMQVIYT